MSVPWIASDYDTQDEANDAWRERIEAVAAAINLDHDQACTDTSRLFFLPRRPTDDAVVETCVLQGAPCNIFGLATPEPAPGLLLSQDTSSSGIDRRSVCFRNPASEDEFDLTAWSRNFAWQFELVAALQARYPAAFVDKVVSAGKHHIRCVNEDAHTQGGEDAATIVINASESTNRGFVYHCRHAHCTGVDRLQFVRQMLERGWLTVGDLTDPAFLSSDQDNAGSDEAEADRWGLRSLSIGSDAEIGQCIVEDLKRRYGQVVHDDGAFCVHNGRHWEAIPEDELWRCAFVYDGARYHTPKGDPANVKISQGRVASILACMVPLVTRARFFAESATGINCASGFIIFADDGAPKLVPHSHEHRQRHVLAGRWPTNPTPLYKEQSLLRRLLDGCFSGDEDKRAKIDLLAEVAGLAALGRATRIIEPKALVCFGKHAENGKSQVLAMVRSLLPGAAVSNISPGKFDDRTFTCHLVGKLLNAPDELAGTEAIASETFKQIITGEPLMVRDVYRRAFEFVPCAQHVYATNNLPSFKGGMDRGVRRRLMVLTFNRVIPRAERIERIGQRIGEQEANLLLDWAVRGASRVLAAQAFTTPASSSAALLDWMYSSDPVLAWLESDEVEFTVNNFTPETQVKVAHGQFVRWACGEGFDQHRLPAVNGFSQRVEAAGKGVTKKRANTGSRFVGLACIGPGSEAVTHE